MRSLGKGLGWAQSIAVQNKFSCHVYKIVWKPAIGEKLQADQELNNKVDKFAGKVVKNNEIVGHFPLGYSRILSYLSHVVERYAWNWLAVDVTANSGVEEWRFLVGCGLVVWVKWKLITWKNSWRARFDDKHFKANSSFRHHSWKKSTNNSNKLSVSLMFISWQLKKFYEY